MYGSVLPFDVWIKIMLILASESEIDRVRSVSVIARDICNGIPNIKRTMECRPNSSQQASQPMSLTDRRTWKQFWGRQSSQAGATLSHNLLGALLRNFKTYCEHAHHSIPAAFSVQATWNTVRSFSGFSIFCTSASPSSVPFQLLYAVAQERNNRRVAQACLYGYVFKIQFPEHPAFSFSDLKFRRLLTHLGIGTYESFREAISTPQRQHRLYDQLAALSGSRSI